MGFGGAHLRPADRRPTPLAEARTSQGLGTELPPFLAQVRPPLSTAAPIAEPAVPRPFPLSLRVVGGLGVYAPASPVRRHDLSGSGPDTASSTALHSALSFPPASLA